MHPSCPQAKEKIMTKPKPKNRGGLAERNRLPEAIRAGIVAMVKAAA
jgi:hypothetical protein